MPTREELAQRRSREWSLVVSRSRTGALASLKKTIAKTGSAKFIPTGQSQCKLLWEAEVGYSAVFRFLRERRCYRSGSFLKLQLEGAPEGPGQGQGKGWKARQGVQGLGCALAVVRPSCPPSCIAPELP